MTLHIKQNSSEHWTHHQNFKNHSQQIILYSYIQYFGLTLTLVSNTVLHWFASPLVMPYAVPQLWSSFTLSSTLAIHYTQHTTSPWEEDCPILAIRFSYIVLIPFLKPSTLFQAALDSPRMFYLFLVWKSSGSLDVRGFVGHHATRCCCSRLQYMCT